MNCWRVESLVLALFWSLDESNLCLQRATVTNTPLDLAMLLSLVGYSAYIRRYVYSIIVAVDSVDYRNRLSRASALCECTQPSGAHKRKAVRRCNCLMSVARSCPFLSVPFCFPTVHISSTRVLGPQRPSHFLIFSSLFERQRFFRSLDYAHL
jgi:hypothetical protein